MFLICITLLSINCLKWHYYISTCNNYYCFKTMHTNSQEKHNAIMESVYAMESIHIAIKAVHKRTSVTLTEWVTVDLRCGTLFGPFSHCSSTDITCLLTTEIHPSTTQMPVTSLFYSSIPVIAQLLLRLPMCLFKA